MIMVSLLFFIVHRIDFDKICFGRSFVYNISYSNMALGSCKSGEQKLDSSSTGKAWYYSNLGWINDCII